ncbi:hypothetical protein IscW_ISCW008753 [Ixodes scapularis]|uniref:Uncharacterized protein n=1 Tax=Ixodes scapularis TaxID=6945 RepID=B7PZM4_IXOSC|nr:hypothetical protein IscW_ISCW008753 [Ixodes scapularis]|eukprot:XP_002405580.1 hypothetical protein IscW_ISCW008753 [Ixodes scapularis]
MRRIPSGTWIEDGQEHRYEPSEDELETKDELEYLLLTFPCHEDGWLDEFYNAVLG